MLALGAASPAQATSAYGQAPPAAYLRGRVIDASTGAAVAGARVEIQAVDDAAGMAGAVGPVEERWIRAVADAQGRFEVGPLVPGAYTLRVSRIGYVSRDTVLTLPAGDTEFTLALEAQPIPLRPLTVRAERTGGDGAAGRAIFEREVVPGVIGVSRQEIQEMPALAAPDVMRSLQALPGVVALNDLSAQLHVRGGGPDQNLFLLDGARIFAPFHMFGMFGALNTDAVGRVEFFRGSLPARYGGALSSVVAIEQREDGRDSLAVDGGVSMLAARFAARGPLPWGEDGEWLLAARRSHLDLVYEPLTGNSFPYAFYDVQGRLSLSPAERHRLGLSFLTTSDRFRFFLDGAGDDLRSDWRNAAGSLRWQWAGGGRWAVSGTAWGSLYRGALALGAGPDVEPTRSEVGVGGLRLEAARRSEAVGLRIGVDVEAGAVDVLGTEGQDGYVQGTARGTYALPALYVEAERWWGPLRLAPGLRLGYETSGGRWLMDPRLALRAHLSEDIALTVGAGRTHQLLSTIRDDRYVLPGAPIWYLRPEEAPASRADGVDVTLDGWRGRRWSFSVSAYARRFEGVPRWRPEGSRALTGVAYDDGDALGLEFMLRHHQGDWTGWLGYGLSRVRFREGADGGEYLAVWDRRHALDAALFWRGGEKFTVSTRMTYGSGMPFWPVAGKFTATRLVPFRTGGTSAITRITFGENEFPIWAAEQRRLPSLFRIDLGARYQTVVGRFEITPFASVVNVSGRPNVLFYDFKARRAGGSTDIVNQLVPVESLPIALFPTIGVDIRF